MYLSKIRAQEWIKMPAHDVNPADNFSGALSGVIFAPFQPRFIAMEGSCVG
jgi:hypothetical protein